MSYSFSVKGATKAEALEKVAAEMAKVVQNQPVHSNDEAHARAVATTFVGLLEDDATRDVTVSVNGLIWVTGATTTTGIRTVGVGVSASLVDR